MKTGRVPWVAAAAVVTIAAVATFAVATPAVRSTALDDAARPVTVAPAVAAPFQPTRRYVASIEPWLSSRVGPQLVSAYVDSVLVRPGARVKRGQVLATLDCRGVSASSEAVSMMARALEAKQKAAAREAARLEGLAEGGYVAQNDLDRRLAESASQEAELLAARAKLLGTSLEVRDCVLRAPFDGEIAERLVDPGAFVRPGAAIATVVDRTTVRIRGDAPENDFPHVAPDRPAKVEIVADGRHLATTISRRAPVADPETRTIRFEIDVADQERTIPAGTTAIVRASAGEPRAAIKLPLRAAVVRRGKAKFFVVEGGIARSKTIPVIGEAGDSLFVEPVLADGAEVVVEGRALLHDGDRVEPTRERRSKIEAPASPMPTAPPPAGSITNPVHLRLP